MSLCECGENVDAYCVHKHWCADCLEKTSFTSWGQVFHPKDKDGSACPCTHLSCNCVLVCAVPDLCECHNESMTCTRLIRRHDPDNKECSRNNSLLTFVNPYARQRRKVLRNRPYQCKQCPKCKWSYGASKMRETIVCDAKDCGFQFCSHCETEDRTKNHYCSLEKSREYIVIDEGEPSEESITENEKDHNLEQFKKRKVI